MSHHDPLVRVHHYDTINFDILWTIIQADLPSLIEQLEAILAEET